MTKPTVAEIMNHLLRDLPWEDGTYRRDTPKVGRNDPCPYGSGKKYKRCCGDVFNYNSKERWWQKWI